MVETSCIIELRTQQYWYQHNLHQSFSAYPDVIGVLLSRNIILENFAFCCAKMANRRRFVFDNRSTFFWKSYLTCIKLVLTTISVLIPTHQRDQLLVWNARYRWMCMEHKKIWKFTKSTERRIAPHLACQYVFWKDVGNTIQPIRRIVKYKRVSQSSTTTITYNLQVNDMTANQNFLKYCADADQDWDNSLRQVCNFTPVQSGTLIFYWYNNTEFKIHWRFDDARNWDADKNNLTATWYGCSYGDMRMDHISDD